MTNVQFASDLMFAAHPGVAHRLVGLFNRSAAMGLLRGPSITRLDATSIRRLVGDLQRHGIAASAGVGLAPLMREARATWDDKTTLDLEQRLDAVAQALELSPAPATEWPAMREVFTDEVLADQLSVSPSSLRRYAGAERATPPDVVARLHWLAMVVSDLAGAYNHAGMVRWFERPRTQLGGRSPRAVLGREWDADGAAAARVRALAAALSGAQALAV